MQRRFRMVAKFISWALFSILGIAVMLKLLWMPIPGVTVHSFVDKVLWIIRNNSFINAVLSIIAFTVEVIIAIFLMLIPYLPYTIGVIIGILCIRVLLGFIRDRNY